MQEAFAAHLRHVGRLDPAEEPKRVVLIIDNAPWHRGQPIDDALAENPHLEFYRLPSYSPHLNVIERFWRVLRRRAAHNRLFDRLADLIHEPADAFQFIGGFPPGNRTVCGFETGTYQRVRE
jgi:transposase